MDGIVDGSGVGPLSLGGLIMKEPNVRHLDPRLDWPPEGVIPTFSIDDESDDDMARDRRERK